MTDIYNDIAITPKSDAASISGDDTTWRLVADINTGDFPITFPILKHLLSTSASVGEDHDLFAKLPSDIASEARLYTRLITSVINGSTDIPAARVLRFLDGHRDIQLSMINFLCFESSPVARSLAKNIFQAALEGDAVHVIKVILSRNEWIDVNESVCHYRGGISTPLQKAALHGSLKVIKHPIERKVDVNKLLPT